MRVDSEAYCPIGAALCRLLAHLIGSASLIVQPVARLLQTVLSRIQPHVVVVKS
eukprot:SAG31_NODE_10457_length_1136_cov_1.900675_1_plen_53_part_10